MSSEANREAQKRYRERLRNRTDEELRAAQDKKPFKKCPKCNRTLPSRGNFTEVRSRPDGFHSECCSCASKRTQKWAKDNPEKASVHQKKYNSRPEVREHRSQSSRERWATDPEYRNRKLENQARYRKKKKERDAD